MKVVRVLFGCSLVVLVLALAVNIHLIQHSHTLSGGNLFERKLWEVQSSSGQQSSESSKETLTTSPQKPTSIATRASILTKESKSPIQDQLCGGCRALSAGSNHGTTGTQQRTCGSIIYEIANSQRLSLSDAARFLVQDKNQSDCRRCLPESCSEADKQYWRLDDAAPTILEATTHYLPSIPPEYRVPVNLITQGTGNETLLEDKLSQYFSNPNNSHPKRHYLFEYNPSIIQLPKGQIHRRYQGERPVYLASYRVSNDQSCFSMNSTRLLLGGDWDARPKSVSYMGLALLRSDLSIVDDVVLDISTADFFAGEDFRLFLLHGDIYVGTFGFVSRLWIKKPKAMQSRMLCKHLFPGKSSMEVVLAKHHVMSTTNPAIKKKAKNINWFVGEDSSSKKHVLAEIFPVGPRLVHEQHIHINVKQDAVFENDHVPEPSFYTDDELHLAEDMGIFKSPFSWERGGACCVPIAHPGKQQESNNTLLLGISHTKTPYKRQRTTNTGLASNQYVSRFYAFEQSAPYRTVAMSGHFCLPNNPDITNTTSSESSKNATTTHPYANFPVGGNFLQLGKTTYNCPAVHFISGMVEKVDDPSMLIIAYGASDCTSRFIRVRKSDVTAMLFPQHQQSAGVSDA